MSERGLVLALQRLHDDPGFAGLVAQDPQSTLGIYDLDEDECNTLISAATSNDEATLRQMAERVGLDWRADHVTGVGALDESEVSTEGAVRREIGGPGALPGDGYSGVMPNTPG